MSVPAHSLRATCDQALEGAAINRAQDLALFNPSGERDSFVEHLVHLHRTHGVPQAATADLLAKLRPVLELNGAERSVHTTVAGTLDDLARVAHRAERDGVNRAVGVKATVKALRRPLQVLRSPHKYAAGEYPAADRAVRDVIATVSRQTLLSKSLRHELGEEPHDQLVALLRGELLP